MNLEDVQEAVERMRNWTCDGRDIAAVEELVEEVQRQNKDYDILSDLFSKQAEVVARMREALQHGPKIGSVVQRGDPMRYLQVVNTYIKDGHLVVVVDGAWSDWGRSSTEGEAN